MPKVSGRIAAVEAKEAKNGGGYTLVKLEGREDGFFDWGRHCEDAGVDVGDDVTLVHAGGKYPRISAVRTGAEEDQMPDVCMGIPMRLTPKEEREIRMWSMSCATRMLQGTDLELKERIAEAIGLAKKMEDWLMD